MTMVKLTDYPVETSALSTGGPVEPIRQGFGRGLVAAGERNSKVLALCADLTDSTSMRAFADRFPERFIEVGVAEQNLVTVAAGLAHAGFIPFTASYAAFSPGRSWEQIKTTASLNRQPVKIVGAHAGLVTGLDGATHQMLEDIALMRVIPNMVVLAPGDAREAEKATLALAADERPGYIRLAREATSLFSQSDAPFEIGPAYQLTIGHDVTVVATGPMTPEALHAADLLTDQNIAAEVIHCPTVKPLDLDTIWASAKRTRRVVTVEEGQIIGGLGSAVAEGLSEVHPVPVKRLGVQDRFGQTGQPQELWNAYELSASHLARQIGAFVRQSR